MNDIESIVIVGAGLAGTRAAETLRAEGFTGTVTLIGDELHHPYDHVPLSKHYLLDEPGYHPIFLHDDAWYADNAIDLVLDAQVAAIDPADRSVTLAEGTRFDYDALLLATGAAPRRLSVPGADLENVHYLRTLHDAQTLRVCLGASDRVVIIGDGFIGCEIAASARALGVDVALVGRGSLPMHRALGTDMATYFRDLHVAHDVELHPNADVVALHGADGRVDTVVLADGTELHGDLVVAGIGAVPRTGLAADAGLAVDNGVVTDEYLSTDAPGIWAAGDIAAVRQPASGRHVRREHWAVALHHGPTAARNMLGGDVAFDRIPFFFTDQYEVWMEFTGSPGPEDELVLRGDPGGGEQAEFIAFWLHDGRLTAGMNINIKGVPPLVRGLIESGRRLDRDAVADPGVDLADL